MAGELTTSGLAGLPLSVRVRKERRHRSTPPFRLDVALEIPPGITILFGPSGAGKSTLLDCIAGLLRPDAGRIVVGETALFDTDRRIDLPPQQRHVAYVFQSLALFPHMSVADNLAYGLASLEKREREERVRIALEAFRIEKLSSRKPAEISGGEKQRAALARSLVTLPRVLLLDEPLTGLDAALKKSISDDLRTWNAAHRIPVIYVTHSREEANALAERTILIDAGFIISDSNPCENSTVASAS